MKSLTWIISLCFLLGASSAYAMVFGGSNLDLLGYPKPNCTKPYRPSSFSDQYELDNYKSEYDTYIQCIKTYVDNAKNDIERIRESANDAVKEANSL